MRLPGHLQEALWLVAWQSALGAQGFPSAQGLTQILFRQDSVC